MYTFFFFFWDFLNFFLEPFDILGSDKSINFDGRRRMPYNKRENKFFFFLLVRPAIYFKKSSRLLHGIIGRQYDLSFYTIIVESGRRTVATEN